MAETDTNSIKTKIRGLLSRTVSNGATHAEAETALALAAKLMTKYAIQEHELGNAGNSEYSTKQIKLKRSHVLVTHICDAIAHLFECAFSYNRRNKHGWFYGASLDLELCSYFYDLIIVALETDIKKYKRTDDYASLLCYNHPRTIVTSYLQGWVSNMRVRMYRLKQEQEAEVLCKTGTALILRKQDNVRAAMKAENPDMKTHRYYDGKVVLRESFYAGADDSAIVPLNQAVCSKGD